MISPMSNTSMERKTKSSGNTKRKRRNSKNSQNQYKVKTNNNVKLGCCVSRFRTIRCFFLLALISLCLNLVIVGVPSFVIFLNSSITAEAVERERSFKLIFHKIVEVMKTPKVIVDSMGGALDEAALLNFTEITYEEQFKFTMSGLKYSFERTGLKGMILITANYEVDKFVAIDAQPQGGFLEYRRFVGIDNTTEDILSYCPNLLMNGTCTAPNMIFPWDREASITHQSRSYYENSFVPPYLFWCPGLKCDIYFGYTHPYHHNGQYYGMVGCAFYSASIKPLMKENTAPTANAFVFDISTGFMITTSRDEDKTFVQPENGDQAYQIPAKDHPNQQIRGITRTIMSKHGNLTQIPDLEVNQMTYGVYYVDYARFHGDGADWLVINYSPAILYYTEFIIYVFVLITMFVVSFSLASGVGIVAHCTITTPLNQLVNQMKVLDSLDFSSIKRKFGFLYEVISLQQNFYFLLDKLEEYRRFLPHYFNSGVAAIRHSSASSGGSEKSQDIIISSPNKHRSSGSPVSTPSPVSYRKNGESPISNASGGTHSSLSSFHRFTNRLEPRQMTIVTLFWGHDFNDNGFALLKFHRFLCEIIVGALHRCVLFSFTDKIFKIAFNMEGGCNLSHSMLGTSYAQKVLKMCDEKEFNDVNISVVSGKCLCGIIGSENQKISTCVGRLVDLGEHLVMYGNKQHIKLIVNDKCAKSLGELKESVVCPFDYIFIPEVPHHSICVYTIKTVGELYDSEWMYVMKQEKEISDIKERYVCWDLLEQGKLKKCREELLKYKNFPRLLSGVEYMIKKNMTFAQYEKEMIERSKDKHESICKSATIFIK